MYLVTVRFSHQTQTKVSTRLSDIKGVMNHEDHSQVRKDKVMWKMS